MSSSSTFARNFSTPAFGGPEERRPEAVRDPVEVRHVPQRPRGAAAERAARAREVEKSPPRLGGQAGRLDAGEGPLEPPRVVVDRPEGCHRPPGSREWASNLGLDAQGRIRTCAPFREAVFKTAAIPSFATWAPSFIVTCQ